jgi:hypothetical protein
MKTTLRIHFSLLCLLFILTANAGSAWANTAANTQIINNATLAYNDGSGVKTLTASVTVTVSLVPAPPNITPGSPQSTSYSGSTTKLTNAFTVTATANGPDTYNVTSTITTSTNTSGATTTAESSTVSLGATVTTAGSTATVLVVPSDNVVDGKVNGIQAGSTVVVGPDTRSVQGVTDNASGTSTITLSTALSAVPAAGVLVAEQKTVLVDVTAGTISTPGTNITVSKNVTITSTSNSGIAATSGSVTDTYTSGTATFAKYVRNVTTSAAGTGAPYSFNSTNYYLTGVTAKPGDVLEYILVSTNSGTGPVTSSVVTDVLPIAYVALNLNAYSPGKEVTYVNDSGVLTTYSAASDSDQATYVSASGTLTVYVGTGATNSAGGSIPGGNKSVLVLYQVKVN